MNGLKISKAYLALAAIATACGSGTVDTGGTSGGAGSSIGSSGSAGRPIGGGSGGSSGNAGSIGNAGSMIITPGIGSGGGPGVSADAACVATSMGGELRPVALFFMMDNSGSMDTVDPGQTLTRWQLISTAVPAFLSDPTNAGIYAGLDFFPELLAVDAGAGRRGNGGGNNNANASCNVADYENPNVPMAILPGPNNSQVTAFSSAITNRIVQGQTPTTPALEGAIHSAGVWATAHPDMSTFVVFMTDGQPNGCASTVANAAAAAAAGVTGTPAIRTYVLGVGPDVGNLDAIAVGGGTGPTAYLVTTGGAAALTAALDMIKGTAVSCDYKVPTPTNGSALDFTAVNVQARIGAGAMASLIHNVPDASACGTGDGWYYDHPVVGSVPPTTITLCPSTCNAVKGAAGSSLEILIGCKTITNVR